MEPIVEQVRLPPAYGTPTVLLAWPEVAARLEAAASYWLATTRTDGRPHVVPVDGIWMDTACYFGGDPSTVHMRNLRADPHAVIHLEPADSVVIVEGVAELHTPSEHLAARLVEATQRKYGYQPPADSYRPGVWRLPPTVVLAWTVLYEDATRFRFR